MKIQEGLQSAWHRKEGLAECRSTRTSGTASGTQTLLSIMKRFFLVICVNICEFECEVDIVVYIMDLCTI